MDKSEIFKAVLAQFRHDLGLQEKAAGAAREGATGDEVLSEGKYDTRATEASYLARGHAMQFEALVDGLRLLESYRLPTYGNADPIGTGALVEVTIDDDQDLYFLLPSGGGITVVHQDREVIVLSLQSPVGQRLRGLTAGKPFTLPNGTSQGCIRAVW
ncbi:MAG: hypothetical protein K9N62_13985 [Verrucomicrobia bacterium]|nr:hypothetical protein [Verrucomicrobiota bacterium]